MTILTVRHLTTYSYAAPVRLGEHRMMLRPRDSNDQRLLKASLEGSSLFQMGELASTSPAMR